MPFFKMLLIAMLSSALVASTFAQGTSGIISLNPFGRCDGPDGKPKVCGTGLSGCCKGFSCGSCSCGSFKRGTCIGPNVAILCAPCCRIGQKCNSDSACSACGNGVKCKGGTCQREAITPGCPISGCIDCQAKTCHRNSDCAACGSGFQCQKCPTCSGSTPATGTCKKTRSNLCPVLDCSCDKREQVCQSNSDCCSDSEICFKCPPCPRSNFFPKSGKCISRKFKAVPFAASASLSGLGVPPCPPCLPDFPSPEGPILP